MIYFCLYLIVSITQMILSKVINKRKHIFSFYETSQAHASNQKDNLSTCLARQILLKSQTTSGQYFLPGKLSSLPTKQALELV